MNKLVISLLTWIVGLTFVPAQNTLFSPENRLSFGKHLLGTGHPGKAKEEFLGLYGTSLFDAKTRLLIDLCNIEAGDTTGEFYSKGNPLIEYAMGKREFELKGVYNYGPGMAAGEVGVLNTSNLKLKILSGIKNGTIQKEDLEKVYLFGEKGSRFLLDNLEKRVDPDEKSPLFAGILSTILPGAGRLYTGDYGEAIASMVLTGIFGYLAVSNFIDGYPRSGIIFSSIALFFNAGNIYGSVLSAKSYNREAREKTDQEFREYYNREKPLPTPLEILEEK